MYPSFEPRRPASKCVRGLPDRKTGHYYLANLAMWAFATAGMGLMISYGGVKSVAQLKYLQFTGSVRNSCLYVTLSMTANATNSLSLWILSTAIMSFS